LFGSVTCESSQEFQKKRQRKETVDLLKEDDAASEVSYSDENLVRNENSRGGRFF
jgi:hypothetical protein